MRKENMDNTKNFTMVDQLKQKIGLLLKAMDDKRLDKAMSMPVDTAADVKAMMLAGSYGFTEESYNIMINSAQEHALLAQKYNTNQNTYDWEYQTAFLRIAWKNKIAKVLKSVGFTLDQYPYLDFA